MPDLLRLRYLMDVFKRRQTSNIFLCVYFQEELSWDIYRWETIVPPLYTVKMVKYSCTLIVKYVFLKKPIKQLSLYTKLFNGCLEKERPKFFNRCLKRSELYIVRVRKNLLFRVIGKKKIMIDWIWNELLL